MNSEELVTIIIPTYKKFEFLEETVNSIIIQDYPRIEVIVTDDGSENFDRRFVESLFDKAGKNIVNLEIIHHEKNIGTVKNLNNAIKKSKGNYFIGLASDDMYYDNQTVSKIVQYFKEKKAYIVTSERAVFKNNKYNIREILPTSEDEVYFYKSPEILFRRLCIGNFISGACTFYSRKCFEKYGLFDEDYLLLEDYPYYIKIARTGGKIDYLKTPTIFYRWGGISTSSKPSKVLLNDLKTLVLKEILPFLSRDDPIYVFRKESVFLFEWSLSSSTVEKLKIINKNRRFFWKAFFRKLKRIFDKNYTEKLNNEFKKRINFFVEFNTSFCQTSFQNFKMGDEDE